MNWFLAQRPTWHLTQYPPRPLTSPVASHDPTSQQRGAAAIEFAIVFPLFFMIFYGIITYGLIFVAQQSLTLAAQEGARAALRAATANPGDVACNTAKNVANWLGTGPTGVACSAPAAFNCPYPAGNTTTKCLKVTVTYPYRYNPLIPLLLGSLMNVAVPTTIGSSATVQLE
jgi:Flp pilus assembly protein TadG